MTKEIWRDVPSFEGLYKVSNTGKVKRLFRNGKERILAGKIDKDGYINVILSKNQKKKHCRLHRIIAEAFVPNPENKPQVNHKDRNKQNNFVDVDDVLGATTNLEWVTASENVIHGYVTGRNVRKSSVFQYTRDLKLVSRWDSIREASRALNISPNNISSCCTGNLKTAGGYIWKHSEVMI